MSEVTDRDALMRYRAANQPIFAAHKPRFLCGPNIDDTLEGPVQEGAVVLEFDDMKAARAWYDSPEYQAAAQIRKDGTKMVGFIINGRAPAV
jgi:uncharacterized protein (DUF1330 family)